ncbi:ras-responsive element-binding protein 1-like isoform X2 [Tigriopus californicus]|nr:ras-responsive element-binding protein 1-like isoform X2 [Tigriopus californicus]
MQIVSPQAGNLPIPPTMNSLSNYASSIMSPFLNGHLGGGHSRSMEPRSPTLSEEEDLRQARSGNSNGEFHCKICKETLGSQREYTAHIRAHNEVKPHPDPNDPTGQAKVYYCCICNKMLSSFSSLDRHMLVHSGERPFSCELCGQTFTTNGNMHRHKRTHGSRDSHESDNSSGGSLGPKRPGRKRKISLDQPKMPYDQISPKSYDFCLPIQRPKPMDIVKCEECDIEFPNYYAFALHKHLQHKSSVASFPTLFRNPEVSEMSTGSDVSPTQSNSGKPETKEEEVMDLSPIKALTPKPADDLPFVPDAFPTREHTPRSHDQTSVTDSCENNYDESEGLLREMKLKGEFPCRICPATYPNLRALKGHNKEHMDKAPYECNVAQCTYSSHDKGTLTRHMRAHTGEKPFECKECNFGFTTKANCERHVKNKHGKNNRNEIRDSIAIHEVDDDSKLTGDEASPAKAPRVEAVKKVAAKSGLFAPYHQNLYRNLNEEKAATKDFHRGRKLDGEKTEIPLDYSMSTLAEEKPSHNKLYGFDNPAHKLNGHEALSPGFPMSPVPSPMQPLFLFQQMAAAQMAQANQARMARPFDLPSYLLAQQEMVKRQQALVAAATASKEQAALWQYLAQMQGGGAQGPQGAHMPVSPAPTDLNHPYAKFIPKVATPDPKGLFPPMLVKDNPTNHVNPKVMANNESDYKMVIKNGVLMKKSKQRRYRTEKPYGCEICQSRFTLRSNMERHLKQQHQEAWEKFKETNGLKDSDVDNRVVDEEEDEDDDDEEEEEDEEQEEGEGPVQESDNEEKIDVDGTDDEATIPRTIDNPLVQSSLRNDSDERDEVEVDEHDEHEEEEEEEGQVANESSGSDCEMSGEKRSAYSNAPHKLPCPYCDRIFPWSSSLNRHILTHTGARPFKCEECPLLFTTKSNCDRHLIRKHGNNNNDKQFNISSNVEDLHLEGNLNKTSGGGDDHNSSKESISSDSPFKCHLCEGSFQDRQAAIDHLKSTHPKEHLALEAKGVFELSQEALPHPAAQALAGGQAGSADDNNHHNHHEDNFDQLRGKFPDYVNRKVICLFCLRKFWSAEDLRRHVRTHTGDRPFSCDICSRRFSLKHSMLRHRRKHDSGVSSGNDDGSESDSENKSRSNSSSASGERRSTSPEEQAHIVKAAKAKLASASMSPPEDINKKPDQLKKRANLMNAIQKLAMQGSD